MKKLVSILLSLVSVICVAFSFAGCEDKQTIEENSNLVAENNQLSEENEKLNEENNQLVEYNKKLDEDYKLLLDENKKLKEEYEALTKENEYLIEENEAPAINRIQTIESGKLYTLRKMYDNGLLKENDLNSIACAYYDFYKYEVNPYKGMFNPNEELSDETVNKIKLAYSTWFGENFELPIESIKIKNYYGTYNGNVAIGIYSDFLCIDPAYFPPKTYIGGVVFQNFWNMDIILYHI